MIELFGISLSKTTINGKSLLNIGKGPQEWNVVIFPSIWHNFSKLFVRLNSSMNLQTDFVWKTRRICDISCGHYDIETIKGYHIVFVKPIGSGESFQRVPPWTDTYIHISIHLLLHKYSTICLKKTKTK